MGEAMTEDYASGYRDALMRCHRIASRCAAGWGRVPDREQSLRLNAEVAIETAEAIASTIVEVASDPVKYEWKP